MPNDSGTPPSPPSSSHHPRRASFSPGQPFSGYFGRSPANASGTSAFPGSIATAAANAQNRRRMSITTLGLSGSSPTQTSPFGSGVTRRESMSSTGSLSGSPTLDENVIEEGDGSAPPSTPATPFARRMSFGARALRDVRTGSGNNANGRTSTIPASSSSSAPTAKGRGLSSVTSTSPVSPRFKSNRLSYPASGSSEGFNWSESLISRAERTSSASAALSSANTSPTSAGTSHQRAQSTASMPAPVQELPKTSRAPDPFQERILKGDFYMD